MYTANWQDAADLYVAVSVTYVDSGKKEIDKYVTTVILPQLNVLVSEVANNAATVAADKAIVTSDKEVVAADKQIVQNYRNEVIGSLENYYTKTQIDTTLTNYATKTYVDELLGGIETELSEV